MVPRLVFGIMRNHAVRCGRLVVPGLLESCGSLVVRRGVFICWHVFRNYVASLRVVVVHPSLRRRLLESSGILFCIDVIHSSVASWSIESWGG